MIAILVCERCGDEQVVRLQDAEGMPLTVGEYRALLAMTGNAVVCDECIRATDTP
jgi:hypothetical protein